jgi:uncharacterized protein YecE (DUF72 family)
MTEELCPGNAQDSRRILVGTSGFSYKEWRGIFYPDDLPAKKYLSFYAQHFHTTEINNTFYRLPTTKLTEGWYAEVPADFSFTLKLSQKITHFKKLRNVDEEMGVFLTSADALQSKLGPILVQLPPTFKKDLTALDDFAAKFSSGRKLAFEFRHQSWLDDDVFELLRRYGCAFGVVETEDPDKKTPREVTAPFVYMRLRKGEYSKGELAEWAEWIRGQQGDVYCYMKHDERAPLLAEALLAELNKPYEVT